MNAFEKVIGYESVKSELLQYAEMFCQPEHYEKLGAKPPRGIMISGEPGLGKTLMANCFAEFCKVPVFLVRRNCGRDALMKHLKDTFRKAKEQAPSIVFLDDMDKFANEDNNHRDAEEYVTVQACIDDLQGTRVLVLATVNELHKLPDSLIRPGRFDRSIELEPPENGDARAIIEHYLKNKPLDGTVNMDDLAKLMPYRSCAQMESFLNDAAIRAGYARKDAIGMEDLVETILQEHYGCKEMEETDVTDYGRKVAYHEAGHLVVAEALMPGCVGLASVRAQGEEPWSGFIRMWKQSTRRPVLTLITIAGKEAHELYFADTAPSGCREDLQRCVSLVGDGISENAISGFSLLHSYKCVFTDEEAPAAADRRMQVIVAELERYARMARDILLKNRSLLEEVAQALIEKRYLLRSDIDAICSRHKINTITV